MSFRQNLSQFWSNVQYSLFPMLEKDLGELSPEHKKLTAILELVRIESLIPCGKFTNGRPQRDRCAIARAFIAKSVFKLPYTKTIIRELNKDKQATLGRTLQYLVRFVHAGNMLGLLLMLVFPFKTPAASKPFRKWLLAIYANSLLP
jgi:hypothetical protein